MRNGKVKNVDSLKKYLYHAGMHFKVP